MNYELQARLLVGDERDARAGASYKSANYKLDASSYNLHVTKSLSGMLEQVLRHKLLLLPPLPLPPILPPPPPLPLLPFPLSRCSGTSCSSSRLPTPSSRSSRWILAQQGLHCGVARGYIRQFAVCISIPFPASQPHPSLWHH